VSARTPLSTGVVAAVVKGAAAGRSATARRASPLAGGA